MIPLALAERVTLDNALASPHSVSVKVHITDLVGNHKSDVTDRLRGGQVDVDVEADVSRTLTLTLLDPNSEVAFDSDDPSEAAIYMDNMVQVLYGVKTATMTKYIYVPIFTGPIVALSRDEDEIEVTAYGKEHLAMGTFWQNFNAKKGANKVDIIKRLMTEGAGESKFMLPEMPRARLSDDLSVMALRQTPWEAANRIAKSMGRVLYYDGAGRLRMRKVGGNLVYTFEGGDGGMLMSVPSINFDTSEAKNAVVVKGRKSIKTNRKDETNKIRTFTAKAVVERNHPLSPWNLGRNGVPRFLHEFIENDKINTVAQAEKIAEERLMELIEQAVEVAFDVLPVPYLEEYDRVKIQHDSFTGVFNLRQFSIPLTIGDTMSVGYNRRLLTVKRGRINTKSKKKTRAVKKKAAKKKEK